MVGLFCHRGMGDAFAIQMVFIGSIRRRSVDLAQSAVLSAARHDASGRRMGLLDLDHKTARAAAAKSRRQP
jgi:hypothetical protein